jgi:phosphocarrier protein HPr
MTQPPEAEGTARIANRAGMHARPAAEFVKLAGRFQARVTVAKDGLEVDGKSIMGVLMLAAEQGAELHVRAEGDDARDAVEALLALVERGFGEA